MGINVPRHDAARFALAAAIGAVAGIVVAPTTSLQFDTGRLFTIFGFIAVRSAASAPSPAPSPAGCCWASRASSPPPMCLRCSATRWRCSCCSHAAVAAQRLVRARAARRPGRARRAARPPRPHPPAPAHGCCLPPWCAVLAAGGCAALAAAGGRAAGSLVITLILFIALLGLDVLMGYAGQVSLGQAGFMAIGGYTAAILAMQLRRAAAARHAGRDRRIAGAARSACPVTMRLRGLYLALATLAFGLLVDSLAVGLDDITGGPSGLVGIPSFSVGAFEFDTPARCTIWCSASSWSSLALLAGAMRSDFGRALQAIRTDQMAAAALGINVPLQAGRLRHQRGARVPGRQPLRVRLQLPVAGDGGHDALARAGHHAGHRRRRHAGRPACSAPRC